MACLLRPIARGRSTAIVPNLKLSQPSQTLRQAAYYRTAAQHTRAVPKNAENDDNVPYASHGSIMVFSDASNRHVEVPSMWLRDHCQCPKCYHKVTKQRTIETFDEISPDIKIIPGGLGQNVDRNGFHVLWSDGHESFYSKEWLASSGLKLQSRASERLALNEVKLWTGDEIKKHPPTVDFRAIMESDDGLREWLGKIRSYGFSYVDSCPPTPEATEKLLEHIAFIRNTHYGGFWDFTADLSSGDTAYTQLGIGPHTDNTYFSDPAGLQMFHLLHHTDGSGGASQLVDGFGAAEELKAKDPAAYEILSKVRVHAHASGGRDISIQPYQAFPTLVHESQGGKLVQVRWNTTDRAAVDLPLEEMGAWYDAAGKWAKLLRKREYWEQLQPGKPLIFDNWRVLHGRSAFTGNRRMCGGYINRDDWISRYRVLTQGKEQALKDVLRG